MENLETVFGAKKSVVFRVPVIGGYTDDEENQNEIIKLIGEYSPLKVELIKEHNLGRSKYESLGRTPPDLNTVTDGFLERYKQMVERETGITAEVCKV